MHDCHENDEDCKSGYGHKRDHEVIHYFGCLTASERNEYFELLDEKQQGRLRTESARFARLRRSFEEQAKRKIGSTADTIIKNLKDSLEIWRSLQPLPINPPVKELDIAPTPEALEKDVEHLEKAPENDPDLKVNLIYYKGSKRHTHPDFPDEFPNQKIPIEDFLKEGDTRKNPLMMDCEEGMIRYFHLPANNMHWVEGSLSSLLYA